MTRPSESVATIALVLGLVFGTGGCDFTTESPDFSVQPSVEAPLVTRQSFVLVGPDSTDRIPLIDTSGAATDSLFSVDSDDESVVLTKQVAVLEDRSLGRLLPSVSVGPGSLSVSARRFLPDRIGATFGDSIGVRTRPAVRAPLRPIEVTAEGFFAVAPDAASAPTRSSLLDASPDDVTGFTLSSETEEVNQYHFTLLNRLETPLVHPTGTNEAPELVVETPEGDAIARGRFTSVANPGERMTARVDVAGRHLTRPLRFRLRATTPEGIGPILERPGAVQVATEALPFRIVRTQFSRIPAQPSSTLPIPLVSLDAGSGVKGIVVQNGTVSLTLRNSLPYPITVTRLGLHNAEAVGEFSAGSEVFTTGPVRVPPHSERTAEVELGRTAVSSRLEPEVEVEGEGVDDPVQVEATDGLEIEAGLRFVLDRLYLQPNGQRVQAQRRLPIRARSIRLDADDDFVTLDRGQLIFQTVRNELPVRVDPLRVEFPSILNPPYASSDRLAVQFGEGGTVEATRSFSALPANDALRDQTLDLSGGRLELPGSSMPIEGSVRLAPDPAVQSLSPDDRVSTSLQLRDLRLQGLQAEVDPLSALIPTDRDGDRGLDVDDDAESRQFDATPLHRIGGTRITALDLSDTRIRLGVTMNVAADADLYLAVMGRRNDGREEYLSGRGPYAVSEEDSTARRLRRNGSPISPDNLLRVPVSGAPSPDESVTRVIRLTQKTANLPEFLRLLPDEMRVIGRLVVQPEGGRARVQRPVTFELQFNLAQPFRVGGDVAFTHTFGADLGVLESVTEAGAGGSVEGLGVQIPYENEFPLSGSLQLEALDEQGDVLSQIPADGGDSLRLRAAPVSPTGTSRKPQAGVLRIHQSKEQLRRFSQGDSLRVGVRLQSPRDREGVVRARDGFSLRLEGAADLRVGPSN